MKLAEIYQEFPWLEEQIAMPDFVNLFPVHYKKGVPQRPDKPEGFDLDRDIFLKVLVAFRNSFF